MKHRPLTNSECDVYFRMLPKEIQDELLDKSAEQVGPEADYSVVTANFDTILDEHFQSV